MARLESKPELILDAAKTLFARDGFHGTTTDSIAREAGIAVGTIYNYFSRKEDILSAIFHEALDRRMDYWNALQAMDSPSEQIVKFAERHFREMMADPRLGIILVDCLGRDVEGVMEFQIGLRHKFTECLRKANAMGELRCDPEIAGIAFLGMLEALVREGVRQGSAGAGEDYYERAISQISAILAGMGARR